MNPWAKMKKRSEEKIFQKMLQDYYALRGWNSEGIPK